MAKKFEFGPYSTLSGMLGKLPDWWPEEEQPRIAAYEKYDQMYWNDPTQYAIRVLEGEQPLYVPNSRIVVDTTAHYLLKGLAVSMAKGGPEAPDQAFLKNFLKRERFYSMFHNAKKTGIARGDWCFHITADPNKPDGSKVSIEQVHPGMVWPVPSDDDPDEIIRMHLVKQWIDPDDEQKLTVIRKLTYERVFEGGKYRIYREEAIYKITPDWFGPTPEKVKQILPREALHEDIDQFPIYWYPNVEWDQELYGSSELRGMEYLTWAVSQGATDTQMALALEGLGVYATDGGRPVNDAGEETDWEVAPGKVMEVPAGSYFRRVEGVGTITPMQDQIKYIEQKLFEATSITDVARGLVDVQVAQSGIALAIRFQPTLAKIEDRDTAGVELTTQMFYDLKKWFKVYEGITMDQDIEVNIDDSKLPENRTEKVNELNNMLDRKVISKKYYREEMKKLGYEIPADIEEEINKENQEAFEQAQFQQGQSGNPDGSDPEAGLPPGSRTDNGKVAKKPNRSNNRSRPNESSGTESGQTLGRQAKPQ